MKILVSQIQKSIRKKANPTKAKFSQRFFKTGVGEYAEGDVFLGLTVPQIRGLVKVYEDQLSLVDLSKIIKSKYHEERLFAVVVIANKSKQAVKENRREEIANNKNYYLKHKKWINNWDLVDVSAEHVMGPYYIDKGKADLFKLAKSKNIWDRRIAVITTFYFIRRGQFKTTKQLCKKLLKDKHDLIHKATGWMLREIGKRDKKPLIKFLNQNARKMPRTMLRYSIEKLSSAERTKYLKRK